MPTDKTDIREYKSLAFQIKEFHDDIGLIKGYLATFDNIDEGGDRIRPGAFKQTINRKYQYKQAHDAPYLMPLLWQHDQSTPIGGYTEAKEDATGLFVAFQIDMDVQRGREAYSGLKKRYIFQQSIGYDPIQYEWVKEPDGKMVRDLIEVRLWEGSIVTFPMNELAVVTSVKAATMDLEYKTACGNTSGPIGPRDESWDGAAAKKWIWSKALDSDGKVKASVAKKYFMQCDGDPSLKTSYGYPFWTNDHISVGGVKAVAGALAGARNADPGSDGAAMRSKVNTLYGRINSKYPDAEKLVPPWKDDDGKSMNERQKKTLQEHFNEELAQDLLRDWQDVFVCSLTGAVFDAFTIGDQPEQDISKAIDDFKEIVLSKFVVMALECDLSQYLSDNAISYTPGLGQMLNGSSYGYSSYMSRGTDIQRKAGRAISASNAGKIQDHVDNLKAMAREHMKAIHSAADDLAGMMGGDQSSDEEDGQQEGKQLALALAEVKALRK